MNKTLIITILLIATFTLVQSRHNKTVNKTVREDKPLHTDPVAEYMKFKEDNNKTYSVEEEIAKLQKFIQNYKDIKEHNENKYAQGNSTYHKGINQFSAQDLAEFNAKHNGFINHKNITINKNHTNATVHIQDGNNTDGNNTDSDSD